MRILDDLEPFGSSDNGGGSEVGMGFEIAGFEVSLHSEPVEDGEGWRAFPTVMRRGRDYTSMAMQRASPYPTTFFKALDRANAERKALEVLDLVLQTMAEELDAPLAGL